MGIEKGRIVFLPSEMAYINVAHSVPVTIIYTMTLFFFLLQACVLGDKNLCNNKYRVINQTDNTRSQRRNSHNHNRC